MKCRESVQRQSRRFGGFEAAGLDKTTMVIFTNTKDLLSGFEVKYGSANARDELGQASVK